MNLSQRDGGLPPDSVVQDEDTSSPTASAWWRAIMTPAPDAMVQIALAPCSPFSVTTSLMRSTADLAQRLNVRLHTHLAETEDENRFCQEVHNCRPLDYLEDCGWLNDRHLAGARRSFRRRRDQAARARRHDNQPLSVQQSGPGVGNLPGLRDGSGRCTCRHRRRWLGLQRRLEFDAGGARGVPAPAQPLRRRPRSATSMRCAGRPRARRPASAEPDIGEIAVGALADLALFKLDELRFSGSGDPLAALVLCGAHRADRVMVRRALDRGERSNPRTRPRRR
jgi:8-oxoguanine deaminase